MTDKPKNQRHYVDDEKFSAEVHEWSVVAKVAVLNDEIRPPVSEYVGECILKIVNGLGKKGSFKGYTYLDEMRADAVENVLRYLHNFNPEASKGSAFIYVSFISQRAFLRRIALEKRHHYYKLKSLEKMSGGSDFDDPAMKKMLKGSAGDFKDKILEYEEKQKEIKAKRIARKLARNPQKEYNPFFLFDVCDAVGIDEEIDEENTNHE